MNHQMPGSFAYLAVMSQFIGFFAWNKGLAMGGVAKVSQVQLLQTFITLGVSALLLGEKSWPRLSEQVSRFLR